MRPSGNPDRSPSLISESSPIDELNADRRQEHPPRNGRPLRQRGSTSFRQVSPDLHEEKELMLSSACRFGRGRGGWGRCVTRLVRGRDLWLSNSFPLYTPPLLPPPPSSPSPLLPSSSLQGIHNFVGVDVVMFSEIEPFAYDC